MAPTLDGFGYAVGDQVPVQGQVLTVLYIFAGEQRKGDLESWFNDLLKQVFVEQGLKFILKFHAKDLARAAGGQDLRTDGLRSDIIVSVREGKFDVVFATLPCQGHSRVLFASKHGPPPKRDFQLQFGSLEGRGGEWLH